MTGGKSPIDYLKAYMTNLYLSKDAEKVTEAIEEGKRHYTFITDGTFNKNFYFKHLYHTVPSIITKIEKMREHVGEKNKSGIRKIM